VVGIAKSIRREIDFEATLRRKNDELEFLAVTDHLTGVHNRRFFDAKIEEEIHRAEQLSYPLVLLFIDLDVLKGVNDQYGHPVGDAVLVAVAKTITDSLKETDVVARYGGDEFCAIAPGAKKEKALEIGERVRERIEKLEFRSGGKKFWVTVSIGIAEFGPTINTAKKLINNADAAAKQAKRSGKNRVLHIDDFRSDAIKV
jgi:diguanylate cyclase (GGDEF)-like protein